MPSPPFTPLAVALRTRSRMYGSTSPKPAAWPVRGVTSPILSVSALPPPPLFFTPPHAASRPLEAIVRPALPAPARKDLRVIARESGRISSDNAVLLSPSPGAAGAAPQDHLSGRR